MDYVDVQTIICNGIDDKQIIYKVNYLINLYQKRNINPSKAFLLIINDITTELHRDIEKRTLSKSLLL